jgi:hypothetical protein
MHVGYLPECAATGPFWLWVGSYPIGIELLFASRAYGFPGVVCGDAWVRDRIGPAAYIERAFDRLVCVGLCGWLVVWCVCCGGGTGLGRRLGALFGRVDCAADI